MFLHALDFHCAVLVCHSSGSKHRKGVASLSWNCTCDAAGRPKTKQLTVRLVLAKNESSDAPPGIACGKVTRRPLPYRNPVEYLPNPPTFHPPHSAPLTYGLESIQTPAKLLKPRAREP